MAKGNREEKKGLEYYISENYINILYIEYAQEVKSEERQTITIHPIPIKNDWRKEKVIGGN